MTHDVKVQNRSLLSALARELLAAECQAAPLGRLTVRHPELTGDDAYAIQAAYAELRREAGAKLVGRKIGATSKAIQALFDIDTPDYGHIFDDMVVADGGSIAIDALIQPLVEPELAFVMGARLAGPGVTATDVLEATSIVLPCIEVIDSRFEGWNIGFVDTVADNGSSARCILGPGVPPGDLDLAAVEGVLSRNGEPVERATGAAVLGHPATSVAWLINAIGSYGDAVEAGDYVLSGSLTTAVRAARDDVFDASFSGVGHVSCYFT